MTRIQILLILAAVLVLLFYFRRVRSRLLDRILLFSLSIVAVVLVARPDWATAVANFLEVGRGTDLVVYLGITGLAFLWLGLYTHLRDTDVRLTELARRLAMLEAKRPRQKKRSRT